jgi:hypothetical protein
MYSNSSTDNGIHQGNTEDRGTGVPGEFGSSPSPKRIKLNDGHHKSIENVILSHFLQPESHASGMKALTKGSRSMYEKMRNRSKRDANFLTRLVYVLGAVEIQDGKLACEVLAEVQRDTPTADFLNSTAAQTSQGKFLKSVLALLASSEIIFRDFGTVDHHWVDELTLPRVIYDKATEKCVTNPSTEMYAARTPSELETVVEAYNINPDQIYTFNAKEGKSIPVSDTYLSF